jgi:hypothetical protein
MQVRPRKPVRSVQLENATSLAIRDRLACSTLLGCLRVEASAARYSVMG